MSSTSSSLSHGVKRLRGRDVNTYDDDDGGKTKKSRQCKSVKTKKKKNTGSTSSTGIKKKKGNKKVTDTDNTNTSNHNESSVDADGADGGVVDIPKNSTNSSSSSSLSSSSSSSSSSGSSVGSSSSSDIWTKVDAVVAGEDAKSRPLLSSSSYGDGDGDLPTYQPTSSPTNLPMYIPTPGPWHYVHEIHEWLKSMENVGWKCGKQNFTTNDLVMKYGFKVEWLRAIPREYYTQIHVQNDGNLQCYAPGLTLKAIAMYVDTEMGWGISSTISSVLKKIVEHQEEMIFHFVCTK